MKQWEKLTAWLVVFALVAGLVGGSAFVQVSAAEENSDFAYVVNEDGTATITEVKTNAADVIVPAVIDGHTVTAIGSHTSEWSTTLAGAFESKWQAVNVYLPDTITSFADRAFASCAVEHIYRYDPAQISAEDIVSSGSALGVPMQLKTMGSHCFDNSRLKEVQIDAQVDSIGDGAYATIAALSSVTLGKTGRIGTIGKNCFQNSGAQTLNFYFYGRVDAIGANAFEGSGGIQDFYMEDVGIVGTEAFKNCHINTMTLKGSLSAIGDRAFIGCGNLDKVTIQSSTPYTIGKYAFTCASIKEVTFSDGLSSVAEGTFSGCGKLSKVYLPTTLKEIEKNAFENVSTITTITINDTAKVDDEAFKGAGGTTWGALDRLNNQSVKKIVAKALHRNLKTPLPKVAKASLKKAKAVKNKKKANLKWTKSKNANGYIVYCKAVKKGKKAGKIAWKKVKTVKKPKITKCTVKISAKQRKVLKKKGKIYYSVRAYKKVTVNGKKKTIYSVYSQKKLK